MMVVRPEITTLTLSTGETLIVKKRLNAGERRAMLAAMRLPNGQMDGLLHGQATILAYLVDWTVKDQLSNEPLIIAGQPREAISRTLDSLDTEDFREIQDLIEAHEDRMRTERQEEKKRQIGSSRSAPDSPSVPDLVSAMPMSMT
jgi:hypothetical protein